MFVVKVPFVEELLKYMLMLASGSPVMILRKGSKLVILTEIGNQPLIFVSRIPRTVSKELEAIYKEIAHGRFVYLDEKGSIVTSDEIPQNIKPFTGIGMILDIDGMWVGNDGLEILRQTLSRKKMNMEQKT